MKTPKSGYLGVFNSLLFIRRPFVLLAFQDGFEQGGKLQAGADPSQAHVRKTRKGVLPYLDQTGKSAAWGQAAGAGWSR